MNARRPQVTHAARFDPKRGPVADYTLTGRRPQTPREDYDNESSKGAAWHHCVHRQLTLTVPALAQADIDLPPTYVESRIELGEEGARELIDQLQTMLEWVREPYESEGD